MRRSAIFTVLLAMLLAAPAGAAPTPGRSTAATPGKPSAKPAPKPATPTRRLEDIRIEGDVPVPQVLFVTARDPRRFLDFGHDRYRKSSLELARTATMPMRVAVVGTWPTVTHKESAP